MVLMVLIPLKLLNSGFDRVVIVVVVVAVKDLVLICTDVSYCKTSSALC